jgi:hypothetical protein
MTLSVSGDSITFPDLSTLQTAPSGFGFKNRIINGDMRIDQRNAGASVTLSGAENRFPVDRLPSFASVGTITAQQSSTAPDGFTNSVIYTVTSPATVSGSDNIRCAQNIEGYNIADLGWGTATAKTITLSFWVRSSLTGTFSGALRNSANDRSYIFIYTISSANTFEYKTITIVGDTTGTWLTTNGVGMRLFWSLGAGATVSGTAGSWQAGAYLAVTGTTSVVGTSGATFYITGVQLEKGSTATAFDYRDYGRELSMCQRYAYSTTTLIPSSSSVSIPQQLPVSMRSLPTASGGGSGYTLASPSATSFVHYQTSGAFSTILFSAEL